MNILVITHMYPTDHDPVYGNFIHDQVKELIRRGNHVKVLCLIPFAPFPFSLLKKKWKRYSQLPKKTTYDGVEVYHPRYLLFPKSFLFHLSGDFSFKAIKKEGSDLQQFPFDLIHSHVALPNGYAGYQLAKQYNVPSVVTIHGKDLQSTIEINEKCKQKVADVIKNTNAVVLVSEKLKRLIQHNFPYSIDKCSVIHNGMDTSKIKNLSLKPKDTNYLLSVGNLYESKGIETNILAFQTIHQRFPAYKYFIIGEGPEKKKLKNLVLELNITEKVVFLGKLPHEEVLSYMKQCTIFSLPSWQEAFGIVYIEAMSYGKPVIACKGEGMSDTIEHEKTGMLVEPKQITELAHVMEQLLENPELRQKIGARAKQMTAAQFSWQNNVDQYIALYKELN